MNYELELSEMVFGGRETGALGNPNSLADMSVLCFIGLMMAMATARTPWTKVLPVLFLPIPIYASFRTGSRNALVGLFIAVVLTYFFYLRPTLRGRPILRALGLTVVLACVGVGAYAALTYAPFAWRYKGMWEFLTTGQSAEFMEESRVVMFLAELRMTMSHPFLGVGLGQDLFRLIEYMPTLHQMFIHSDFAGLGGLIGLPGWALFYVILISLTVRGHRLSKHPLVSPQEAGLLIFCVIFMVSSITRTFYGSMYAAIYSWVLWGGIAGYILSVHARVRAMESAGRLAPEGLSTSETAPELGGVVRPGF
jgi:hypothetical protein